MIKKIVYILLSMVLLLFLTIMFITAWLRSHDAKLVLKSYELSNVQEHSDTLSINNRKLIDFKLTDQNEEIEFRVSLPERLNQFDKLPVIIVLGGFQIGKNSLAYIPNQGENAFISYDYPVSSSSFDQEKPIEEISRLRDELLKVPAQFSHIMDWLLKQNWADKKRINLMGYSFGALILPAIQNYTQHKVNYSSTIISYGAVDIDELLLVNFGNQSKWINSTTCYFVQSLIYAIEPRVHLAELNGQFLLMNGKLDKRILFENALRLQELVKEPKTIVNLDEGHMHPQKPALTLKIVKISRDWLVEKKLINR